MTITANQDGPSRLAFNPRTPSPTTNKHDRQSPSVAPVGQAANSGPSTTTTAMGRYEVRYRSPKANADVHQGRLPGHDVRLFARQSGAPGTRSTSSLSLSGRIARCRLDRPPRSLATSVYFKKQRRPASPGYPGGRGLPWPDPPAGVANYIQTDGPHLTPFEWTATKVTWYVDGNRRSHVTRAPRPRFPICRRKIMMKPLGLRRKPTSAIRRPTPIPLQSEYEWFRFYKQTGETLSLHLHPRLPASRRHRVRQEQRRRKTTYP